MNKKKTVILVTILSLAFSSCTITHKFGPFSGKVVDAETGEPIEGAAVVIGFHTKGSSVGGWVYSLADAVETLTNADGEFRIPPKRITLFKVMSIWDEECRISIFKPGYGAYPGHHEAVSSWEKRHSWYIPEREFIIYFLPKLSTLVERKKNLLNIKIPLGIPNKKIPNMRRLENEEYVNVGFGP